MIEINVIEPTKCGTSINSYISYKVVTKAQRSGFGSESVSARRFSDFMWLNDELLRLYPAAIFPSLPQKQSTLLTLGSPEFIEERRRCLKRFLFRIAEHPTLGYSSTFAMFLQASETSLSEVKKLSDSIKEGVTDYAKSWFKGTANSVLAAASGGIANKVKQCKLY